MAAAARAAHLIVDRPPVIFADTLAYALLGEHADELVDYHRLHGAHLVLSGVRAAAVTRARYTEDRLADAARQGAGQYVILGAGLDSYAYRAGRDGGLRVFEVDHPATQEWKRQALARAGVAVPDTVTFVPVDFESENPAAAATGTGDLVPGRAEGTTGEDRARPLPDDTARGLLGHLVRAGFDPARPAFVSWLGVTMYLTRPAVAQTLAVVGGFAPGSRIVVDHMLPAELRDEAGQAYVAAVMPVAAEGGEPWLSVFGPGDMAALLGEHGLAVVEHAGQRDSVDPSLWDRADTLRPSALSMLTLAEVP
ncbi:S-adenosyl-L-methionine-dependent methyltransferase [Sphaerisporangium melleum]|uniref:S-adenosyl-L-methionine-dependent methyltransferase n=2 Tax=Sphaerisporangium melleum TaxID=321316 RepID=A0A917VG81_9ACTN|nr:S-adenosyl-L-methionine-dependent methyltransferase [Sphaerisporangium melleum]GII70823.1 S-adenosyl-L-methionine-dependent methyltransferase [Sphaerisporangium melleum]